MLISDFYQKTTLHFKVFVQNFKQRALNSQINEGRHAVKKGENIVALLFCIKMDGTWNCMDFPC